MTTPVAGVFHCVTPAAIVALRAVSRWNEIRRKVVASRLRRMFRKVDSRLCEPGSLPAQGIHRVLVCRPNHRLGNAVLMSPLIQEIETLYPGAEIDILAADAAAALFSTRFGVRQVFALPQRIVRHLWFTTRLLREMRGNEYDLAIDASEGSQSGRLVLALARARFKLGFPDKAINPDSAWHAFAWPRHHAQRNVFLLRTACGATGRAFPPLQVGLSPDEMAQARQLVTALRDKPDQPPRPMIGVFTNATGAKRYGEDWWLQFLQTFEALCPPVQIVDLVAAHGRSQLGSRYVPYYTRNVRRLAAVVANMDGFISADCGVMHLAAATGTPVLGLFAVTDPAAYAPYGGANAALSTQTMDATEAGTAAARWFTSAELQIKTRRAAARL
jgi:ADP-heptose:LPS heptosyltransferase